MTTESDVPFLEYARADSTDQSKRGRGFIAVCVTFFVTGLGHAIVGRLHRGLIWFIGSVVVSLALLTAIWFPRLFPALLIIFPLGFVWSIAALVDAYICGHHSRGRLLRNPLNRYLAGAALIVLLTIARRFTSPAIAAATLIKNHVAEAFVIPSRSMSPTILPKDRIICHRLEPFSRWSIVVIDAPPSPGTKFVERIVGLPGETVQIVGGQISVNGVLQAPPAGLSYTTTQADGRPLHGPGCQKPMTLGPDEYFCLGDNSPVAGDSRYWPPVGQHQPGALPRSSILGTVTYIYWPPSHWKSLF
jgi:signal peptidase I